MAKGIPVIGRAPDKKAKIINVDELGNLKVSQLENKLVALEQKLTDGSQKVTLSGPLPALSAGDNNVGRVRTQNNEVVAYVYDKIVDIIGAENIVCLLPCWETEGTVLTDLLNPEIKFNLINSGELGYPGPLHAMVKNSADLPALELAPQFAYATTGSWANLTATGKLAQKIPAGSLKTHIGTIWLSLHLVGELPTATIKVSIYEDNDGSIGDLVCASQAQRADFISPYTCGFNFHGINTVYNLNRAYWIVLEYVDTTGVDASNYVRWRYGAGTSDRATYDGATWAVTPNQTHAIKIYNNYFSLPKESTTIFGGVNLNPAGDCSVIRFYGGYGQRWTGRDYSFDTDSLGKYVCRSGVMATCSVYDDLRQYAVFAATLTKGDPYDTQKVYVNGRLRATDITGHETGGMNGLYSPFYLAARGNLAIGPYILVNQPLTHRQIATVSSYLTTLRKFGG